MRACGYQRIPFETFLDLIQQVDSSLLQIAQTLYMSYIEEVPLFQGCSSEFINQIVSHFSLWHGIFTLYLFP